MSAGPGPLVTGLIGGGKAVRLFSSGEEDHRYMYSTYTREQTFSNASRDDLRPLTEERRRRRKFSVQGLGIANRAENEGQDE